MRSIYLALAVVILLVGVSLGSSKEHGSSKKKVLKDRSEPLTNNTAAVEPEAPGASSEKEAEKVEKDGEKTKESSEVESSSSSEAVESETTAVAEEEETHVTPSKPSYLTRVQNLLRRVLEVLGLSRQKRKNRKIKYHQQDLVEDQPYVEEVRTTVGALLGRKDCLKRVACRAGAYLRSVKGKEVLIVLLEKFAPPGWADSVNQIKEAAIYKDACNYRCLED